MKKTLLAIVSCLLLMPFANISTIQAQHVNTLYFLENSPHRHYINPALAPLSNFYLALPAIGYTSLNVGNNSLTFGDLVYKKNGQTVTFLHPDPTLGNTAGFLKNLRNSTLVELDAQITLLSFGARTKRNGYWHFSLNERIEGGVSLPKGMFEMVLGGGMTDLENTNTFDFKELGINTSVYTEAAIGYMRNINEKWAVGGKIKFLYGHAYAGMYNQALDLSASSEEWNLKGSGYAMIAAPVNKYPESLNLTDIQNTEFFGDGLDILGLVKPQGLGGAIDLGFTYKPHEMVQIAASVTDLGVIVWNKGVRYDYTVSGTYEGVGDFNYSDLRGEDGSFDTNQLLDTVMTGLTEVYGNAFQEGERTDQFIRMTSPRLNVGVDANFWDNRLGLGVYSSTRLVNGRFYEEVTVGGAFRPCHWFQLAASYSILNGRSSNVGAALGFVTYEGIGLTIAADYVPCTYASLNNIPIPYNTKGFNLAFGLNLVIGHKNDKDRDGVKNKYDLCPNTPRGVPVDEFGCPMDTDGDGVPDYVDECPNTPAAAYGFIDEKGCVLDTDGDGVADYLDLCPNTPEAAYSSIDAQGCPLDSDKDGVYNYLDLCPNTPIEANGMVDEHGCLLDTDGDGVPDYLDICPNTPEAAYGTVDEHGCPIDSDQDGVPDYLDKCPDTPLEAKGMVDANGCEIDTDKDGIPDWCDNCPTVAGLKENKGCPAIKREVRNTLQKAMSGIEFETGKAKIKKSSYKMLDQIAKIFIENPTYKVEIQGHTDNVGKPAANLRLSDERANAVRDYLIDKGVPAKQLTAKGYGDTMPIASNKTKAGRAKNRRVEFVISFEEISYENVVYSNDSTYSVIKETPKAVTDSVAPATAQPAAQAIQ